MTARKRPGPAAPPANLAPAGQQQDPDLAAAGLTRREFLAKVRHDLRTSVVHIIGYSEMLQEEAEDSGQAGFIPDLQKIQSSGKHLVTLIQDLLGTPEANPEDIVLPHVRYELRIPLNHIIGYSEMLQEQAEEAGQNNLLPDLRKVQKAARNLLAQVEELLVPANFKPSTDSVREPAPVLPKRLAMLKAQAQETESRVWTEGGAVLVVDDNEDNRDLLARRLGRQGYRVTLAENGRQALKLLRAERFELVLLDMIMPDLDGQAVLEQLKADKHLRHIPVVMLSALDELDSVVHCLLLGAEDYLTKPFNPVLLKARIGACLEKNRLREQEQAYLKQLQIERAKSENLLLNILPRSVAERLKKGESTIVDSFEEVSVLFADLVGFTSLSAHIAPTEVVRLLDEVFSAFDLLAAKHGLEKIKTIGDAYMAVAGVPTPRPDHAQAAAALALDMLREINQFNAEYRTSLCMRIGINSGAVIAGIIGRNKFIYDLWGDTVNTASRMESHGQPGTIQVTEETYARLKGHFRMKPRGSMEVKGKGPMLTYLVVGPTGE